MGVDLLAKRENQLIMLDIKISREEDKWGHFVLIIILASLIILNILFLAFTETTNSLILTLLTSLLGLSMIYINGRIFTIHFSNSDIIVSNFLRKEKRHNVSEFEKVTTYVAMAGIYKLNLKTDENYLFVIPQKELAKNLFNIDPDKYAKELTREIFIRIDASL